MDAMGQGSEVSIKRARYDARMVGASPVKANKMLSIERQQRSFLIAGESQNIFVRYCLTGFPGLV